MTKIVFPDGTEFSDDGTAARDMRGYGYMAQMLPLVGKQIGLAQQTIDTSAHVDGVAETVDGLAVAAAESAELAGEKVDLAAQQVQLAADQVILADQQADRAESEADRAEAAASSVDPKTIADIQGLQEELDSKVDLPSTAGKAGKVLGVLPNESIGLVDAGRLTRIEPVTAITLTVAHVGHLVDIGAAAAVTLSSPAALTAGWYAYVRNRSGAAFNIVQANGEKTTLLPAQATLLQCDGTVISFQDQGFDVGAMGTLSAGTAIGSNISGSTYNSNIVVLDDDTIVKAFVDYATGNVSFRRGVLTGGVFVFGPALVVTTGVTNSQWGIDLFKISATKAVAFYYSGSSTWVVVVESSSTNSLVLRSNSGSSDNGTTGLRNGVFQLSTSRYVLVGVNSSTNTVAAVYSLNLTTDAAALINAQPYTGAGNQNVPGLVFKISGTEVGIFSAVSSVLYRLTFNLTTGVAVVSPSRNQTSAGRKLASVVQISTDRFFTSAVADFFSSSSSIYARSTTGIRSTAGGNFFRTGRAAGDAMPAMRAIALSETKASFVGVVHNPNYDAPSILFGPVESPADFSVAATLPLSSGSALSGDGVDIVALSNGNYAVSYYSVDQHLVAYLTRGTLL